MAIAKLKMLFQKGEKGPLDSWIFHLKYASSYMSSSSATGKTRPRLSTGEGVDMRFAGGHREIRSLRGALSAEALNVLYANTCFRFHTRVANPADHSFFTFRKQVYAAHFSMIPALEITFLLGPPYQPWEARYREFCGILAAMPKLRKLKLMLISDDFPEFTPFQEERQAWVLLMKPLTVKTSLKELDIALLIEVEEGMLLGPINIFSHTDSLKG
ncbi:predicted protein [Uncinocarpus reesii 1704]|uniref:Uncharacterized protein n=1 Tax=Uncinocarpus reesii (strain UAMH 1704) TaxID=336963 RepID=C4JTK5_UNCRE|nr:uncharacterized protein UREG_05794 [Uncinocarpus reesii 1704]EEP80952.1 predicted protein [Uncinocarpus reesii 1704]